MIDFTKLTGIEHDGKVVTQIEDSAGRVLWAVGGGKVILEVEKVTSDTYAGETTYKNETFILLDIYPKTNGTVKVTYGGITRMVTDTSGAEEPNAIRVIFGTFNGVSYDEQTPQSGELTIEGDYYAFGCGGYSSSSKFENVSCSCIKSIENIGAITTIPDGFLGGPLGSGSGPVMQEIEVPDTVLSIGGSAFAKAMNLKTLVVGKNVKSIGSAITPMSDTTDGVGLTVKMKGEIPPKLYATEQYGTTSFGTVGGSDFHIKEFVVPKGKGDAYRGEESWASYKDYIVEES